MSFLPRVIGTSRTLAGVPAETSTMHTDLRVVHLAEVELEQRTRVPRRRGRPFTACGRCMWPSAT